jgi:outer membrane protein assembly factor BamB
VSKVFSFNKMISAPVIVGNKILTLSSNGIVSAFDAKSYKKLWSNTLSDSAENNNFQSGGISVKDNLIFIAYGSRHVVTLDLNDGKELWRARFPDIVKSQPVVQGDVLVALTVSNQLCALSISTGSILWQHDSLQETLSYGRAFSPIIIGNAVLVAYSSGNISMVDLSNGQDIWQISILQDQQDMAGFTPLNVQTQPIIDGDNVYLATANNLLLKLDLKSGKTLWQKEIQDIQTMNKSGNTLFITTNGRQVAAINDIKGEIIWVTTLINTKEQKNLKPERYSIPIILNNTLSLASSSGKVYNISPIDGVVTKTFEVSRGIEYFVVGDNVMVFSSNSAFLMR